MWNNNPGGSTTNDWGTDTHTFNASDALDTADFDLSQRSRNCLNLQVDIREFTILLLIL